MAAPAFRGYDYLDSMRGLNTPQSGGAFWMRDPQTGALNPALQTQINAQNTLAASRTPARGEQRYGFVRFGQGMDPERRNRSWQEKFSITPGAGLWAIGINPDDPQAEAKAKAYIERQLAANPYDPNAKQTIWGGGQWGRDDAKMPGIRQILAQNPNVSYTQLADYSQRALQTQNALQPRNFDLMTIVDPIITAGLGFINPALSAVYAGGRTAGEGGDFGDILLSAGGGYLSGMGGANIASGVNAAGGWANYARNIGSSIANAPSNALNYLRYGPELSSAEFASYFPGGAAESTLSNINTASLFPRAFENAAVAGRLPGGTAAGMSNAARAAGAIGSMNNPGRAGVTSTAGAGPGGSNMSWFSDVMQDWGVSKGDLVRAGIDVVSGIRNANAVENAARMQANAAQQAANIGSQTSQQQMQLARDIFAQQTALNEPFRQGGVNALNRMQDLLGISGNRNAPGYGSMSKNFTMADFQADPGYAFRMSEGLKALDRQAAARGGLISGGALKAAQGYGQDLASQEYLNAFNRFQTNRTNLLNPLQSIAGAGQTATTTLSQAGQNMGTNVANYMGNAGQAQAGAVTSAADARASGYLGAQEGWNRAINSALSRGTTPDQQLQRDYINALIRNAGNGRRSDMLNFAGVG